MRAVSPNACIPHSDEAVGIRAAGFSPMGSDVTDLGGGDLGGRDLGGRDLGGRDLGGRDLGDRV